MIQEALIHRKIVGLWQAICDRCGMMSGLNTGFETLKKSIRAEGWKAKSRRVKSRLFRYNYCNFCSSKK
jgi:hypothetical protein